MTTKRHAWKFGRWAEFICACDLRVRGYRILFRRLRTNVGEIDIVARRGTILAIVEVKARRTLETAAHSVSERQRHRISRAAMALLQKNPGLCKFDLRFDVMLMTPWRRPVHLMDAWRPNF